MQTIHNVVKADGQFTDYLKKLKTNKEVDAELQQGVFNDVNELGTSKKKRKKKS